MSGTDFDVVQIGYGPVGQTFAALAGKLGCKVGVYERYPSLYGLPRAGHIDHEIMRIFQSIGCAATVEGNALRSNKYEWRNAAGQVLLDFEWNADGISGWASDYLIFQPDLEDALDKSVRATPTVSVNLGKEAVGIIQYPDHVQLTVCDSADPNVARKVTARYLVAADGGNSFTRRALGVDWLDLGFSQPWLVVDFREKRPLSLPFENGQICDPARPMCLFQLGKAHRRFSYMVMPGEEEWAKQSDTAWSLVRPWVGPDDVELIRQATYVFESKLLDNWKVGRVIFAGDSAHVMPPFMGQGMCSGIRDAANLAWKLALVLSGQSTEDLLDSYCLERKPHVADLIRLSMDVGRISCTTNREEARKRDEALLAGKRPDAGLFPGLVDGILMSGANVVEAALVGRLGLQGRIELNGKAGRADDLLGSGWQLISLRDPHPGLSSQSRNVLDRISAKVLHFDISTGAVDVDGVYSRYFDAHRVSAVLVRPDHYIYCAAQEPERLNASIEQLGRMLLRDPHAAELGIVHATTAA
jgi:2-polyprenyl-6-methoxyphenol hydroxylase-like FAD-dependent oxidoreductase